MLRVLHRAETADLQGLRFACSRKVLVVWSRIVARSRTRLLCPLIDCDKWEKSPGASQNLCQVELQKSHSKSLLNHQNDSEVWIRHFMHNAENHTNGCFWIIFMADTITSNC
jgi:hypothetical protein